MNDVKPSKILPYPRAISSKTASEACTLSLRDAKRWLTNFYGERNLYAPGDDTGTTYLSFASVLLAGTLTESESPGLLANLTDLPYPFVSAICLEMKPYWPVLDELKTDLKQSPVDFKAVGDALGYFSELAWNRMYAGPRTIIYLNLLRDRTLVGGERQEWVDAEFHKEWNLDNTTGWA
jgi:hypothetical protein